MGTISLSIPTIGQPDTTEDVKIQNNFTAIQTVINGNIDTNNLSSTAGITSGQLASSAYGRRLVGAVPTFFTGAATSGNNYVVDPGNLASFSGGSGSGAVWWYLDPANFALAGKTTQMIVRMSVAVGSTAPAVTIVGGLASVTWGAATNAVQPVFGTAQGSTSIASPGATTASVAESSPFAFPTAGAYIPYINLSAGPAGNNGTSVVLQFFVVNS